MHLGLDPNDIYLARVGVILATGIGGMLTFEEELLNFGQGGKILRFSPIFITTMIPNMAAGALEAIACVKAVGNNSRFQKK